MRELLLHRSPAEELSTAQLILIDRSNPLSPRYLDSTALAPVNPFPRHPFAEDAAALELAHGLSSHYDHRLYSLPEHDELHDLIRSAHDLACGKPVPSPRRRSAPSRPPPQSPPSPTSPTSPSSPPSPSSSSSSSSSSTASSSPTRHPKAHSRARNLTAPNCAMAFAQRHLDTAPGSPPDLTNSKSSKSSSFQSSSLADLGGSNDASNFEDISLEDLRQNPRSASPSRPASRHSPAAGVENRPFDKRTPLVKSKTSPVVPPPPQARDLTGSSKSRKPGLQGQVHVALREQGSLGLPSARPPRRAFTAGASPTLSGGGNKRSRSASPAHAQRSASASSRSLSRQSSRTDLNGSPPMPWRPSWQGGRKKTVEELEAEYDDRDDDLPEDAIIYNVPISPRAPHARSMPTSPVNGSPPRSGAASEASFPSRASSRSGRSPVAGGDRSPDGVRLSKTSRARSRSYQDVFTGLDPEVQQLTAALEQLAEAKERLREAHVQKGKVPPPDADDRRAAASPIELPPIQKRNIMIDPLPPSREKEKVLTRTRPSWLPPKDPKEDKRHTKEYLKMQAAFLEAEKKRVAKEQQRQQERDSVQELTSRLWDSILPNWADWVKHERPRVRELFWAGVPPRLRATVWPLALGNALELNDLSYSAALNRANVKYNELMCLTPQDRAARREFVWLERIERDADATFPELNVFQPGRPLRAALTNVLKAYAMYRHDVGHAAGVSRVAALLLLSLDESRAFVALANALNRSLPMAFLVGDAEGSERAYATVLALVEEKLPQLHKHLTQTLALPPASFLEPLLRSCLAFGLGADAAARAWDVFVFDGDAALVRGCVAALGALEGRLYGEREEVLGLLGWEGNGKGWKVGEEGEFVERMRAMGKKSGRKGGDGEVEGRERKGSTA